VADREQSRDAVDDLAEIIAVAFVRGAGVDRRANLQAADLREILARERARDLVRGFDGIRALANAAQNSSPNVLKT